MFTVIDDASLPLNVIKEIDWSYLRHIGGFGPGPEVVKTLLGLLRKRVRADACGLDASDANVRAISDAVGHLILEHIEDVPVTAEQHYLRTLLLAGHMFGYSLLWASGPVPLRGAAARIMSRRLRDSLTASQDEAVRHFWMERQVSLLWALFIATASLVDDDRDVAVFLVKIKVVCGWLGCRSQSRFEAYLRSMAWNEKFGRTVVNRLWLAEAVDLQQQPAMDMQSFVRTFVI